MAVIIAGFLPIYALTGPSGKLFQPMADTTIYALLGSLVLTLTLIPVLCASVLRGGVKERANNVVRVDARPVRDAASTGVSTHRARDDRRVGRAVRRVARHRVHARRRVHAEARRGRALGARDDAVHDLVRGIVEDRAADPRDPASFPEVTVVASEHGRDDAGTDPTGFFNAEFYVGLKPYGEWNGAYPHEGRADRRDRQEARRRFPASRSTTRSRPKTRSTKR